jgi:hypothetical protein
MKRAVCSYVFGLNGCDLFAFQASIPHGRGKQTIQVEVPIATIKALAAALEHTDSPGHAAWHVEHPDSPAPCSSCRPR